MLALELDIIVGIATLAWRASNLASLRATCGFAEPEDHQSIRLKLAPSLGKAMQRQEFFQQFPSQLGEAIAARGLKFDKAHLPQLRQPGLKHGWRGFVAGRAQGARCQRL